MNSRDLSIVTIDSSPNRISLNDISTFEENFPEVILWCRDGLFRLIPRPIIANAKYVWENRVGGTYHIYWEQGVDLDPKIARILLGE